MGWIVSRQSALYAEEYGWTTEYEALAAEIVAQFLKTFDAARERCWVAERDAARVGAVMIVRQTDAVAKLRLLHVERATRGLGIGRRLVDECVRFSRDAGYEKITLWTQSNLLAARHLYEAAGFRVSHASHTTASARTSSPRRGISCSDAEFVSQVNRFCEIPTELPENRPLTAV